MRRCGLWEEEGYRAGVLNSLSHAFPQATGCPLSQLLFELNEMKKGSGGGGRGRKGDEWWQRLDFG